MSLLSEDDSRRIEHAIAELEQQSAAEFVVAVVPRSADYLGVRALLSALWAMAAAIAYLELLPDAPALWAIVLQVPVALVSWLVFSWAPLLRKVIAPASAQRAVEARAFQLFSERGVHHTREATGMLLLLSELEHRVVLLGDRGIHQNVGSEGWQKHVSHVIESIHAGRTADGIIEVIRELSGALAHAVPVSPQDVNELSNQVVRAR